MKVLLDEDLPHKLRAALTGHDVWTVAYAELDGLKNGALLLAAEARGFDLFVTGDQNLSYQQNLSKRSLSVVLLTAIEWPLMLPYVADIQAEIDRAQPGSFARIECGAFRRR